MEITGNLRKMESSQGEVVHYQLPIGAQKLGMNELMGHQIHMEYMGKINCVRCGRETNKSFANVGISLRDDRPSNEMCALAAERLVEVIADGNMIIPLEDEISPSLARTMKLPLIISSLTGSLFFICKN